VKVYNWTFEANERRRRNILMSICVLVHKVQFNSRINGSGEE
jgi:hypothetical protein